MNRKEKNELLALIKKCLKTDGTAKSRASKKDLQRIEELSGEQVQRAAAKPAKEKLSAEKTETFVPKGSPVLVLDAGDPFALGTLRVYNRLSKKPVEFLPLLIYKNDPVAKAVLQQYIIRSEGGCDFTRGKIARTALASLKN